MPEPVLAAGHGRMEYRLKAFREDVMPRKVARLCLILFLLAALTANVPAQAQPRDPAATAVRFSTSWSKGTTAPPRPWRADP